MLRDLTPWPPLHFVERGNEGTLEIDGGGHSGGAQSDYDAARTANLEARGYRVVRIRNDALQEDALKSLLEDLTCRPPSPQRGEGVRG